MIFAQEVIKKILFLVSEDREKQCGPCADPEETVKLDFECKLKLMQRVVDECLARLLVQNAYLAELKDAFCLLTKRYKNSDEPENLETLLQEIKNKLYISQMSLIEYSQKRRSQTKCLVKNLSFFCLVDILNRFFHVYNIKSIDLDNG